MDAGEAVQDLTARFRDTGIDDARLDARVLVAYAMGVEPEKVFSYPEMELNDDQALRLAEVAELRINRQPLARITGEKEFWSLTFQLSDDTLVPRPETETVVEAVLDLIADHDVPCRVLDLGTGSGCLLISLLHELPVATGVGIDISEDALRTATENARRTGVYGRSEFLRNDWCAGLTDKCADRFDIIVSNPPYIPDGEIRALEPEVSGHEPLRALAGGSDGLDIYRQLVPEIGALLAPSGIAAFEIGFDQADAVGHLGSAEGLKRIDVRRDLAGIPRCVVFKGP